MVNGYTVVLYSLNAFYFFFLGATVGSFLNVVVYRLPLGLAVTHPPSRCPRCEHPIRARDNVPVFGWLLLRGRCRDCGNPISLRYPAVEALLGMLVVALAFVELLSGGVNLPADLPVRGHYDLMLWYRNWPLVGMFLAHWILLCVLLSTTLMEVDGSRLPRRLVGAGLVLGSLACFAPDIIVVEAVRIPEESWGYAFRGLVFVVVGLAMGTVLGLVAEQFTPVDRPRERHTMFALAMVGLYLGWQAAAIVAAVAIILSLTAKVARLAKVQQLPCAVVTLLAYAYILTWRWMTFPDMTIGSAS